MATETKQVKHTPGPWHVGVERKQCVYSGVAEVAGTKFIADLSNPFDDGDTIQANARLIAAAPDLLEACKAISTDPGDMASGHEQALKLVRAAIAKAR